MPFYGVHFTRKTWDDAPPPRQHLHLRTYASTVRRHVFKLVKSRSVAYLFHTGNEDDGSFLRKLVIGLLVIGLRGLDAFSAGGRMDDVWSNGVPKDLT